MKAEMTQPAPVVDTPSLDWIRDRPVPLDFGGPVDTPFRPLDEDTLAGVGMFERAAELWPDKLAVDDGEVALTYAELLDRVHGLAHRVAAATPPGGAVISVLNNGPAAIVAIVAALAAKRTSVPIDASHPVERQSAILAQSGATAVILPEGEPAPDFLPADLPRVTFDVTRPTGAPPYRNAQDPDVPAVVMFTSGSTGRPKGLAHSGSGGLIARYVARLHVNADDVFISLASMSQTGAADLIALSTGATVQVVDMKRRGIAAVLGVMASKGVTILSFVPSVLRSILAIPGAERAFAKLRVLDLHGEKILASDIRLFREKLPKDCAISVTYGSTEAGGVFSWFVRDEAIEGAVTPLGYLAQDKQVAIIDPTGAPTPPGEVGELLVRGPMALGSWQNGKVSDARFLPDPEDPTRRIYAMGDLVRMRPDGLFEFMGRHDRQTKVRGLWVDLGEIESALLACDTVADAVVTVAPTPGQTDTLAAFVVPADPAQPLDLPELRRRISTATAEHMVPSAFKILERIPRLPNYKPDLQALERL